MALMTLLLKRFPEIPDTVVSVSTTTNLRLVSLHNEKKELVILPTHNLNINTRLECVETFAWQDDNYSHESFQLLIVNDKVEICLYSIAVKDSGLEKEQLTRWDLHTIFQSFQEVKKSLGDIKQVEILKFEAKEAVFLFDGKVVVSVFPSAEEYVQVTSIVDLREDSPVCRKVLLAKDSLLALNEEGTKLFVYSFLTNSKVSEIECNSNRAANSKPVSDFVVNSQLSLAVLVSSDGHAHPLPLARCAERPAPSPVTAFSKHLPSLLERGPRRSSVHPLVVQGQLLLAGDKLCSLHASPEGGTVLSVHALNAEAPSSTTRLPHPAVLIKSGSEEVPFPILVFSDSCMYLLLYDIEQDKLVNELMVYPSSSAVEAISALNNWSNIHMDIKVLTLGLSNRQLYTVQFFLKTLSEGFCLLWGGARSDRWAQQVQKESALWETVLEVVLDSVKKSMEETHSCQYAEQLLQVSMNMVIQMMSVIDAAEESAGEEKAAFLSTFSRALLAMRGLLRERARSDASEEEESVRPAHRYSEEVLQQWRKWDKMSPEEVIEDSILNGCIPMAQTFFSCHKQDSTKGSYSDFELVAENLLIQNLRQGCMDKALDVLLNIGMDVDSKLVEVFKSTSEKDVRELMREELCSRQLLSQSDVQSLKFLSLLEKLYPCSSFEHAKMLLHEKHTRDEVVCAVAEESKAPPLPVGDFLAFHQDNSESGAYCRLVLEWLSSWDGDTRGRVLAPHYLKNFSLLQLCGSKDEEWEINPGSVWSYLLEHGNLPYLTNWADIWLGLHPRDSDGFSALDRLPISQEMVNMIPEKAPLHVSESLLNGLAKYGIFCEGELENISSLLNRLGRAQCDLSDLGAFDNEKACLSHAELCHMLVHYCLKHNLVQFLYTLLRNYSSTLPSAPLCQECDVLALSLTKTFYMWSQNHNDPQLAYAAATSAAKHVFSLSSASPATLIRDVPLPLALGILLLGPPQSLSTLCPPSAVREHSPLLYNFLFKTPEERAQPDITVYGLLKGNTVFDSTQLFGWQSANALRSEESQNELPHFSLQSLCEQYGLRKELTYLYYLMEGRPNYAYLKFVAQEVLLETGLSKSRVQAACREVSEYALSNSVSLATSSACVYFLELLGQDSLPLRVSLVAANMLREGGVQEVETKLRKAYVNKEAACALVNDLEQVVIKAWHPFKTDENAILQDIIFWMPVMAMSHLHEVEAGSSYLMECAKQNQWLKFIVFAQIFQVPKEQVLKAASAFSDPCISYHIFHSLHRNSSPVYDAAYESKTVPSFKAQRRDMRSSLYARIGLRDLPPSEKKVPEPTTPDDIVSIASEDTSTSSDTDLRFVVLKDLFSQLLLAQNSDYPWDCLLHTCYEIQNPVLALLAASYSDARLENCFYMWLHSSLCRSSDAIRREVEENFDEVRVTNCSTDDIEELMLLAVKHHKILTLWKGVHIFLPNTPLASLMSYLRSFLIYKNFKSSIEKFQNQLWDYPKASGESSVLMSLTWIENVSISILKMAIIACSSSHERIIMLKHLSVTRMEKSFSKNVSVPPFTRLYNMLHSLGNEVEVEVQRLFGDANDPGYNATCWGAVEALVKLQKPDEVRTFAEAAGLSPENVLLLHIKEETCVARSGANWSCVSFRADFWKGIFQKLKVLPLRNAIDFVESQVELSPSFGDKYFMMKLLLDELAEDDNEDVIDVEEITKRMWCYCIKAEINQEISPEIFDVAPVHNFDVEDVLLESRCTGSIEKIEYDKEREALGSIIGAFLSKKDVKKAFELATQFKYQCNDLIIIKTCLELARGDRTPDSVDLSLPKVALDVPSSRIIRSLILWVTTESNALSTVQKNTIKCMESLTKMCTIAVPICHQILVHSVISMVLGETYGCVSQEKDVFNILRRILVLKLKDEFVLAKSLITVHELADREMAKFLSEEIWQSLKTLSISSLAVMLPEEKNAFSEECIYDPLHTSKGFQLIVKLCQDPSLLGHALMATFNNEAVDLQPSTSEQSFYLLADVCVCAHECFTAACNMEGISQILHCAQLLVSFLEEAKKFNIMVYLMVRLQRYNEMMYIFEILKANDKISILFAKDMEEYSDLRHSLLDFLKRYPTTESEPYYYELASRFGMHREKAEILEMAVHKTLAQLCKKNTDANLKEELEKALQFLSDAAKSYCEADCLHQAQNCTRLAQLVALQIYFVPAGIWIIGLNDASVTRFITDHDKFSQAYIVAEEYDKHHLWSQSVLHNVVLRGDREYLHDFKSYMGLSTSLIVDVAKRFSKLPSKNEGVSQNMRMLLSLCPNARTKYSLASELGFADMTSEMMMGDASAYLRDLMANGALS